jgi:ATP-binding cassette subfamily B protein
LIAFARILAFAPQILILDEATSNIDSETEEIIRDATHKLAKGRTSVLIAHRLSTIEKCDKILQLDQGRIVRSGRLKDLFPNGINRELYEETVTQENQTLG